MMRVLLCFTIGLAAASGGAGLSGCDAHRPGSGSVAGASSGTGLAETRGWVEGGAGRLRVSDGGKGAAGATPVILVHGLGSELEVWRAQLEHLRVNRRVVAFDQRGHGASERARDGVYRIEALAEDLEAVRAAMGLERAVLVGHSMSGEVLTAYAGQHPARVAGLVYLDAEGDPSGTSVEEVRAYFEKTRPGTLDAAGRLALFEEELKPAQPMTRERVAAGLQRVDPKAFGDLFVGMMAFTGAKARFARYQGPALAVEVGERPVPELAAAGLGIRRISVTGVSHWLQVDDPEAVNRALDEFLASLR